MANVLMAGYRPNTTPWGDESRIKWEGRGKRNPSGKSTVDQKLIDRGKKKGTIPSGGKQDKGFYGHMDPSKIKRQKIRGSI